MNHHETPAVTLVEPAELRRALGRLDDHAALLLAAWHADEESAGPLPAAAADLLESSLVRLVEAELPLGSILAPWGRNQVLALLPATTPTAAARAARRAKRAWRAQWHAPVHFAGAAAPVATDTLARAEQLCQSTDTHRRDRVALVTQ